MDRYAAFLRGINLGPSNKIAMPALRDLAERLGYTEVRTYINSGNLIFTAAGSDRQLSEAIHQGIRHDFGLDIDVAVRTGDQLRDVLAGNPYPDGDPSRVTVAFLVGPPPADVEQRLAAVADEPYVCADREVWVNYTRGQAGSRLAAQFSRVVGVSATVRNVRTLAKVVDLL
jgi:uncharacterized protein (DUF1697 family)